MFFLYTNDKVPKSFEISNFVVVSLKCINIPFNCMTHFSCQFQQLNYHKCAYLTVVYLIQTVLTDLNRQ